MAAILLHGVPDTSHVWDDVIARLSRHDVQALSLPGFGIDVPPGFTATKEAYFDWLVGVLERLDGPVDLVGHDWGCMLTARVASLRPDLVRTWAGGSGPISANYEWHAWAAIWQTPGRGERWMEELDPATFAAQLASNGVPVIAARDAAGRMDGTMRECILRLYRSALGVGAEWEADLGRVVAPSLVFWGARDPAVPLRYGVDLASRLHAHRMLELDAGHWTPLERPAELASALERHWALGDRVYSCGRTAAAPDPQ